MKEPKDKRTKEYKEWKKHQQALQKDIDNGDAHIERGGGDIIEEIAVRTGVKKAIEWIAGEDCGCNERKAKVNKKVRLRFPVVRCFTEQQYKTWKAFRHEHYNEKADEFVRINAGIQKGILIPIYAQLFARQLRVMSCCVNSFFKEIDQVYLNYKK